MCLVQSASVVGSDRGQSLQEWPNWALASEHFLWCSEDKRVGSIAWTEPLTGRMVENALDAFRDAGPLSGLKLPLR